MCQAVPGAKLLKTRFSRFLVLPGRQRVEISWNFVDYMSRLLYTINTKYTLCVSTILFDENLKAAAACPLGAFHQANMWSGRPCSLSAIRRLKQGTNIVFPALVVSTTWGDTPLSERQPKLQAIPLYEYCSKTKRCSRLV